MIDNFEVDHLFEGQVHERPQFSLTVEGLEFKGIVHGGDIHWYHPHPQQKLEEEQLNNIESEVYDLMSDHLE